MNKIIFFVICLFLGLVGIASAQTRFTMPPPAGVYLGGYQVVNSCGSASLTAGWTVFGVMDTTGVICTSAGGGGGGSTNPFTPNGNYTTLTATAASSASTALPAGATVAFQNTSNDDVSCVLSAGVATATTNKQIVHGGSTLYLAVGSNVNAACINQVGAASNVIALAGGTGLGTSFGSFDTQGLTATVAQGAAGASPWLVTVDNTFAPGQATMANSSPVVIASDQSTVPVSPIGLTQGNFGLVHGTTAAMVGTTSTSLVAAVTSQSLYINRVKCNNTSSTATLVQIRDGSAGTVLDTLAAGATYGGEQGTGSTPLFWTTAGNALFAQNVTTGASVICTASGYSR